MKTEKVKIEQTPDDLFREVVNGYEKFRQDLERFPFEDILFEMKPQIDDDKSNLLIEFGAFYKNGEFHGVRYLGTRYLYHERRTDEMSPDEAHSKISNL